tara:strand:+ start:872 stop:2023 length:1152 start_codon:yes stop_codon:yes gene_type:complete
MENQAEIVAENTQREVETAVKPNFDLLSTDSYINGEVPVATNEEVKEEVKSENTEEVIESEIKLDEEKPSEEVKEEVTEEVKEEVIDENAPLTLDEDSTQEEEGDWIVYAKSEGLEIAENSVEAYIEAKTAPLKEEIEKAKALTKESLFSELAPEQRMYMELADAGYSHEEIVNPLKNIEKYKSMDSVALYREDLTVKIEQIRALTDTDMAWIDQEIERKVESGEVEHEATRIRLELDAAEKQIVSQRSEIIEKYKANRENNLLQARKAESESVTKALNELSVFMNQPLAPEVKKGLTERFNNGKYDQLMKDPNEIAKFIAYKELGEKAVKSIEAKSYNKGKLEYANKMHNTPPLEKGGASRSQTIQQTGNFERLENDPHLNS